MSFCGPRCLPYPLIPCFVYLLCRSGNVHVTRVDLLMRDFGRFASRFTSQFVGTKRRANRHNISVLKVIPIREFAYTSCPPLLFIRAWHQGLRIIGKKKILLKAPRIVSGRKEKWYFDRNSLSPSPPFLFSRIRLGIDDISRAGLGMLHFAI